DVDYEALFGPSVPRKRKSRTQKSSKPRKTLEHYIKTSEYSQMFVNPVPIESERTVQRYKIFCNLCQKIFYAGSQAELRRHMAPESPHDRMSKIASVEGLSNDQAKMREDLLKEYPFLQTVQNFPEQLKCEKCLEMFDFTKRNDNRKIRVHEKKRVHQVA